MSCALAHLTERNAFKQHLVPTRQTDWVVCIVPGGGVNPQGQWQPCKRGFFLPVRVLSRLFRRLAASVFHVRADSSFAKFLESRDEPIYLMQA